ncbi:MAG: MmcQ/YjbR family DNA-binding protein [Bacteroidota bacterium]
MLTQKTFRQLALSFPGSEELPHFDKASFRYRKKIFATLWEKENKAMIKLPVNEQSVFCTYDALIFSPVPGTWGKQGATFVDLLKANKQIVKEALAISFQLLLHK